MSAAASMARATGSLTSSGVQVYTVTPDLVGETEYRGGCPYMTEQRSGC